MVEGAWIKPKKIYATPGGDPVWVCSVCGGDTHVAGIETAYNEHHVCKNCGSYNLYPYEYARRKMDNELKPCPFCGRKPKYVYIPGWYGYSEDVGKLKCECGNIMSVERSGSSNELYKCLLKRWNERA